MVGDSSKVHYYLSACFLLYEHRDIHVSMKQDNNDIH